MVKFYIELQFFGTRGWTNFRHELVTLCIVVASTGICYTFGDIHQTYVGNLPNISGSIARLSFKDTILTSYMQQYQAIKRSKRTL